MWDIVELLERRQLDVGDLRERCIERQHLGSGKGGMLSGSQGWTSSAVAEALERDPHTIGWTAFELVPRPLASTGGRPRRGPAGPTEGCGKALPEKAGIGLANWNWKVVRRFVQERFGLSPSRSSCLNYLHRLGFVLKRPKKRFLKADEAKREAFVAVYAELLAEAQQVGAKVFFADEAHFRADADLRGKWVLKGEPALVDSTSPRWGEKASYYSAVCLETGEVELRVGREQAEPRPLSWCGKSTPEACSGTSPSGDAMRAYLATPDLGCDW